RRLSARTRSGAPSRRSTRRKAPPGCVSTFNIAWSRCSPSPGFSTSIRRSSRFTAIRKARSWATIPKSRGVRAIAITPIRWLDASCSRCRRLSRRRTYLQARRAEPVGAARSAAARPLANLVAWRLRFRQRGDHARGRGARTCLPVQAAPDRQRQTHDREARRGAGMGVRRPRLRGEGERGSADGLEPAAARDRGSRRRLKGALGLSLSDDGGAPQLAFIEIGEAAEVYEYSVLVTSLDGETEAFGQLYRDRGDGENIFDEMKNQWGWGGFTTHDLARCRLAARLLALFYDWWNIFVRLADPSLHREAITSRPLFLSAIATRTRHARQTTIRVTSSHAKAKPAAKALAAVVAFLRGLTKNAEQLTRLQTWRAILSRAFQAFLNGRLLRAPPRLAPS